MSNRLLIYCFNRYANDVTIRPNALPCPVTGTVFHSFIFYPNFDTRRREAVN